MVAQVVRPENAARFEHVSLGEYLQSNGYSDAFVHNYILPMCAAVWSMPSSKVSSVPPSSFASHCMLAGTPSTHEEQAADPDLSC